ncbi:MAG: hypothetical protein AVDCRST_MAG59-3222 [uncultured Thermomicrobiales bacterium]|jgi:hypothetical protein|uniref:Uncharacterized protein n=1 Tax=uncultured Thermomicrobiales bacterium TaxID=1645740 RepID=A0A6J4V462_9BACT|nr:MAG: hypothetical protein AVDCRST_MAG59-3222 [uncultured Thermomicrobiales bacterium]
MDETRIEETVDEARPTRRLLLRTGLGLAAAGLTLTGLAACGGGEGGEGGEGEEEEEEDD